MPLWRLWVTAGAGTPPGTGSAGPAEIHAYGNSMLPSQAEAGACSEGARMELLSQWVGEIPGAGSAESILMAFCSGRGSAVALADLSPCCSWSSGTVPLSSCSPCKGTAVQRRKGKR